MRDAAWGWRRPAASAIRAAWAARIVYVAGAGAAVWLLGLGRFQPAELASVFGDGAPDLLGASAVAIGATTIVPRHPQRCHLLHHRPAHRRGGSTAWFAVETGLLLAVTSVAASAWLWRRWAP